MRKVTTAIVAVMIIFGLGAVSAFADLDEETSSALAPADAEEGKICPYCGAENPAEARYCVSCGEPFPHAEGGYESPPDNGEAAAAEDEDSAPGDVAGESWYDSTYPEIKRNALATGFNLIIWARPPDHLYVGFGADVAFVLRGLIAIGPTFDVDLLRYVDLFSEDLLSAWFGGIAGRVYFRPYFRKLGVKPYVGGGYGRCRVPVKAEFRKGYYFRYNMGFEVVGWPFAVDMTLGGQTEKIGETRNYFTMILGLRFFI